jgi:hypothetical protein
VAVLPSANHGHCSGRKRKSTGGGQEPGLLCHLVSSLQLHGKLALSSARQHSPGEKQRPLDRVASRVSVARIVCLGLVNWQRCCSACSSGSVLPGPNNRSFSCSQDLCRTSGCVKDCLRVAGGLLQDNLVDADLDTTHLQWYRNGKVAAGQADMGPQFLTTD